MLSAELTRRLGLKGRPYIAVQEITELEPDMPVIYELKGEYQIDRLTYDEPSQLLWIERGGGDFVFLTDLTVLGTPIGYCARKDVTDQLLKFQKIPPVCDR